MASIPPEVHRRLAAQHGHVSRPQLAEAGLTANQIRHLLRRGDLTTVRRRVYRSPSVPVSELGRCVAVCLGRDGAVISGPTAGRIWGFRKMTADRRLHVLLPPHANGANLDRSVVAHRTAELRAVDVFARDDGIRVTGRARTCLDLASSLAADPLLSVIEQAILDGGLNTADLLDVALGQSGRRCDVGHFLAQLDRRLDGGAAESDAEVRVGTALARSGVTGLVRQHATTLTGYGRVRFDLAVPALLWAVEVDLFPTHEEVVGALADAERDRAARRDGWLVRRVTRTEYEADFRGTISWLAHDARTRRTGPDRPDPAVHRRA